MKKPTQGEATCRQTIQQFTRTARPLAQRWSTGQAVDGDEVTAGLSTLRNLLSKCADPIATALDAKLAAAESSWNAEKSCDLEIGGDLSDIIRDAVATL